MAEQTAVEWLMRRLFADDFRINVSDHQLNLFQQAEKMHKEQIIKGYADGYYDAEGQGWVYGVPQERYYNETFGK